MTDGMPTASGAATQAKAAATDAVTGIEEFFETVFDLLIPIIAGIIGIVVGPLIFTGQCIADGISSVPNISSSGIGGDVVFAIGHLAGAGIIGTGAAAAWHYQEGKHGLAGWVCRAGGGFAVGWTIGILIQFAIAETTGNTGSSGNGGIIDNWVDQLAGKMIAGAKNLAAKVP